MRTILVSSLFLSTALLPAQSAVKGQDAVLEARNPGVTSAASDRNITPQPRVSTGVVWPRLISQPSFSVSAAEFPLHQVSTRQLVLGFDVDRSGRPQNVHVVQSVSPSVDNQVAAAVRKARYAPGRLDDQSVPVAVNLVVNFQQSR